MRDTKHFYCSWCQLTHGDTQYSTTGTLTSLASGSVRDKSTNRSIRVDGVSHTVHRLTYASLPERGFFGLASFDANFTCVEQEHPTTTRR